MFNSVLTVFHKAKAPPAEDESSGGSSEEFQPSDSSEGDTDDEDHEQDDDDEGGDVGLNDAAARLNRKQTRKAAKEKAIKKAIIAGTFVRSFFCSLTGTLSDVHQYFNRMRGGPKTKRTSLQLSWRSEHIVSVPVACRYAHPLVLLVYPTTDSSVSVPRDSD